MATIPKEPNFGTTGYNPGDDAPRQKAPNGEDPSLPPLTENGNINWLNGSYAGADIKVVAHLYTSVPENSAIVAKQKELATYQAVVDAASKLSTYASFRGQLKGKSDTEIFDSFHRAVLSATGESESAQVIVNILHSNLYNSYAVYVSSDINYGGSNFNFPQNLQAFIQEYEALAQSTADRIKQMREIDSSSSSTLVLEQLQTISIQGFREKNAVRSLGKSYVSGYTRGPRTLGGSMIFTMIREHPLTRLIKAIKDARLFGNSAYDVNTSSLIPDQLPPIDLTLVFANEYGSMSRMGIYGVEFSTDGLTLSSEDIMTECVCQFVARDIDIPTSVGTYRLSRLQRGLYNEEGQEVKGSDLYFTNQEAYNKYIRKIGLRHMFKGR